MEKLFTQALGLAAPWWVQSVDLSPEQSRIDFVLAYAAKRGTCPACGAGDQPVQDHLERIWQHLNVF